MENVREEKWVSSNYVSNCNCEIVIKMRAYMEWRFWDWGFEKNGETTYTTYTTIHYKRAERVNETIYGLVFFNIVQKY